MTKIPSSIRLEMSDDYVFAAGLFFQLYISKIADEPTSHCMADMSVEAGGNFLDTPNTPGALFRRVKLFTKTCAEIDNFGLARAAYVPGASAIH
jgi:hypothetical protein